MGRVQIITFVILKASHFNIFIQSNSLFVFDTTVNPSLGGCALCFQFLKLINPLVSSFTKSSLRESQEDFFVYHPPDFQMPSLDFILISTKAALVKKAV